MYFENNMSSVFNHSFLFLALLLAICPFSCAQIPITTDCVKMEQVQMTSTRTTILCLLVNSCQQDIMVQYYSALPAYDGDGPVAVKTVRVPGFTNISDPSFNANLVQVDHKSFTTPGLSSQFCDIILQYPH